MAVQTQKLVLGSEFLVDLAPERKIDTRGQVCPYPSFETAKLAQTVQSDEVIEIISDDKYAALNSIPTVLRLRNFEYGVLEIEEGVWSIKARRAHP
ncbi:MAG: sulfurtransferase TusA family protein [Nitrososphaerales archaeon]